MGALLIAVAVVAGTLLSLVIWPTGGRRRQTETPAIRHPAYDPNVPPGVCPVCKADPGEKCDAGLHS